MSIARNSPASLPKHCALVRRFLAYSLLALALLSYGSLPSPNLGFHLQSGSIGSIADTLNESEQVLAPQQANEYRGRGWLGVIEHQTDEQGKAIFDRNRSVLSHRAIASRFCLDECTITQNDLQLRRLARGPPTAQIA